MKRFLDRQTYLWMRPILAVLFGCLLLFCCVGLFVLNQLRQSVEQSSGYLNRFVQSTVDKRLEEIYRYTLALELNSANTWMKTASEVPDQLPASVYRLHDSIRDLVTTTAVAGGLYIYYPEPDFVVGNLGCYSADGYRTLQTIPGPADASAWTATLASGNAGHFLLDEQGGEQALCYVRPQVIDRAHKAVMVMELNVEELLQAFTQAQRMEASPASLYVFLEDTIVASQGAAVEEELARELFRQWDGTDGATLAADGTAAFFSQSVLSGLYYAAFYTESSALRTLRTSVWVCAAGALATLAVGLAGAVHISRSRVKPLRTMLKKLGGSKDCDDAYRFLNERIDKLLREHSQGQQRIYEHQMLLDASFLSAVLRGDLRNEGAVFSAANRYGVILDAPVFQILLAANAARTVPEGDAWRKQLIDEGFTDPMMGLYLISEQLNVSNSYLSTAFKNAYQISVVQYINKLRVDRAKQMIVDTSMSIKEIALATGFSSDIHFIRVFKKQENKTPTMLRRAGADRPAEV